MSKKMTTLTSNDKDILLSKSPFVLPDNPSNKQFSANQIRRKMYEPLLVLLDWLKRMIAENNENVNLTDAEIARIDGLINQIKSGDIIVGKALRDSVGNIIVDHYETKADAISKKEELNALIVALGNLVEEKDTTIHRKVDEEIARAIGIENNLDDKIDDTLIAAKRYADGLTSKAYKAMGSVNSYADLPTNPNNGDVYNVLTADPEHNIQAGENVVWNGTQWDELGGVFDTSEINAEITQLKKDVAYLETPVTPDSELSLTSENPVQNKVIAEKFNEIVESNILQQIPTLTWNGSSSIVMSAFTDIKISDITTGYLTIKRDSAQSSGGTGQLTQIQILNENKTQLVNRNPLYDWSTTQAKLIGVSSLKLPEGAYYLRIGFYINNPNGDDCSAVMNNVVFGNGVSAYKKINEDLTQHILKDLGTVVINADFYNIASNTNGLLKFDVEGVDDELMEEGLETPYAECYGYYYEEFQEVIIICGIGLWKFNGTKIKRFISADIVSYDNTNSGLEAKTVQEAIDDIKRNYAPDSELSTISENPVQNKVITNAINNTVTIEGEQNINGAKIFVDGAYKNTKTSENEYTTVGDLKASNVTFDSNELTIYYFDRNFDRYILTTNITQFEGYTSYRGVNAGQVIYLPIALENLKNAFNSGQTYYSYSGAYYANNNGVLEVVSGDGFAIYVAYNEKDVQGVLKTVTDQHIKDTAKLNSIDKTLVDLLPFKLPAMKVPSDTLLKDIAPKANMELNIISDTDYVFIECTSSGIKMSGIMRYTWYDKNLIFVGSLWDSIYSVTVGSSDLDFETATINTFISYLLNNSNKKSATIEYVDSAITGALTEDY